MAPWIVVELTIGKLQGDSDERHYSGHPAKGRYVYGKKMALAGANSKPVVAQRESSLGARSHDLLQISSGHRLAVCPTLAQQSVHLHPSRRVELDADRSGLVAKNEAEELAPASS